MKAFLLTIVALAAFAFNSVLCRLALREGEADAAGFSLVRLASGAAALALINYFVSRTRTDGAKGSWASAFFLFAYVICFSFAYIDLSAATGALILFGSVQLTMIAAALYQGERPAAIEWLGLGGAVSGLVYLVLPGLSAPPLESSGLMMAAGAAWGVYSLRGRNSKNPLAETTDNFIRSVPLIAAVSISMISNIHLSERGILLAVVSGAVTSGVGYAVWYAALRHHTATRAAILQLSVPVLTAAAGIVLLGETATIRLATAAALILGGILLTIIGKRR